MITDKRVIHNSTRMHFDLIQSGQPSYRIRAS